MGGGGEIGYIFRLSISLELSLLAISARFFTIFVLHVSMFMKFCSDFFFIIITLPDPLYLQWRI